MRKVRVFIAGPITPTGRLTPSSNAGQNQVAEYLDNVRQGIDAATKLITRGFAAYCPFVDFMYFIARAPEEMLLTGATMQSADLSWLECADAILLLPGWETSGGVRGELELANKLGIPAYYSIDDLVRYFGENAIIC
jgi:hypothetical protein